MNKMNQKKKIVNKLFLYVTLIIVFIISIFPFYWMFMGGTNFSSKMFTNPPTLSIGNQFFTNLTNLNEAVGRSEERRVGKECGCRRWGCRARKKTEEQGKER